MKKKAWENHPLCKRCKVRRTKYTVCSKCTEALRKDQHAASRAKKKKAKKAAMKDRGNLPEHKRQYYVDTAKLRYHDEGYVEVDDNALVSWTKDAGGAYVQAWVWVRDEEEIPFG